MSRWWERAPEHDKRIARGDDYAGDAWRYIPTGEIKVVVVGGGPPTTPWPDDPDMLARQTYIGKVFVGTD